MEVVEALRTAGGIAAAAPLVAASSRRKLRTAVARGEIVRVGHDRYALPVAAWGQRLAVQLDAHLSHLSAALHHGWEVRGVPAEPHLILPTSRPAPTGARAQIRWYDAAPGELDGWATAPLLTVLLCARDLDFAAALAVADSSLRHGDVGSDELARAAASWPERVRSVALHATAAAANPFESALRALTLECGLAMVPQFEVRVGRETFHPDLVDPIHGIIVEADSWLFHAGREAHDRDCRRYTVLTADGWRVLRFTYDQVMHQPDFVRQCLLRLYAADDAATA